MPLAAVAFITGVHTSLPGIASHSFPELSLDCFGGCSVVLGEAEAYERLAFPIASGRSLLLAAFAIDDSAMNTN